MKILDPSGTMGQVAGRGMVWVPLFLVGAVWSVRKQLFRGLPLDPGPHYRPDNDVRRAEGSHLRLTAVLSGG
jgi:hypothetical protein